MPKGVYKRSERHKEALRLIAANARASGGCGRYERTEKHRADFVERVRKLGPRFGEKAPNWRGDKVGYGGIHDWMNSLFGKPNKCDHCQRTTAKRFDWANISGQYKRDRSDWLRLCRSCHMKSDGRGFKAKTNEESMAA